MAARRSGAAHRSSGYVPRGLVNGLSTLFGDPASYGRLRPEPTDRRTVRWPRLCLPTPTGAHADPVAHNPKVAGSNPAPATTKDQLRGPFRDLGRASLLRACQRFVNGRSGVGSRQRTVARVGRRAVSWSWGSTTVCGGAASCSAPTATSAACRRRMHPARRRPLLPSAQTRRSPPGPYRCRCHRPVRKAAASARGRGAGR
jgi:hypothetical protein